MSVVVNATWEQAGLHRILAMTKRGGMDRAIVRACSKAGATALRDMRAEARKRIRARKRIKVAAIGKAITLLRPTSMGNVDGLTWTLAVGGLPVPLIAYPHRQTAKGVDVEVNVGKRSLVLHAFIARMPSGHEGIFRRRGKMRNPIEELLGSRPVDALLHAGEAQGVADRGAKSFGDTFARLLPLEIEKIK